MLRNEGSGWCHLLDLLILLDVFDIPTIEDFLIQWANVCPRNNSSPWKYWLLSFGNTRSKVVLLVWSRVIVSDCFWIYLLCWVLLHTLTRLCQTCLYCVWCPKRLLCHTSNRIRSCLKGLAGWLWRGALCLHSIWTIIKCCNSGGFLLIRLLQGYDCLLLTFFVFLFIVKNLAVYILVLL